MNDVGIFVGGCIICRGSMRGKEGIDRVSEIICRYLAWCPPGYSEHVPNRTVASPVFSASETLYFCCRIENDLSPFRTTLQTRLEWMRKLKLKALIDGHIGTPKIEGKEGPEITVKMRAGFSRRLPTLFPCHREHR
jgi:hypothetical protein